MGGIYHWWLLSWNKTKKGSHPTKEVSIACSMVTCPGSTPSDPFLAGVEIQMHVYTGGNVGMFTQ